MKKWLNDLKEGDTFWQVGDRDVFHCIHKGDAHNMNFRMPRIKVALMDTGQLDGLECELFVNQYVYDNKEEAISELLEHLKEKKILAEAEIRAKQVYLGKIEDAIKRYDNENTN